MSVLESLLSLLIFAGIVLIYYVVIKSIIKGLSDY